MSRTFFLKTTWDPVGQQPLEIKADENQSIKEAVSQHVPLDVQEWRVIDKDDQDITNKLVRDIPDKSVIIISTGATPAG